MKFFIRTLGCKMNLVDSARVAHALRDAGHEQVDDMKSADLVLVNSCTVTAESDRKSSRAARGAVREGKRVVVMGCGPRVDRAQWQRLLPKADIMSSEADLVRVLGIEPHIVELPAIPRSRLPVPIQHGCDNTCAYCITRFARGPHRSVPAETVVDHVARAVALGMKEVVLTGINLAAWGCNDTRRPEEARLASLLRALLDRTTIQRIRLSSLGPEYLNADFFDLFSNPRICDHLHLSVQSGSPDVLARMKRGHGVGEVRQAAQQARALRPDVALTADFIVGLPGESDEDFRLTLALVREVRFAQLHVFPFSPREGTEAATMPEQLSPEVKKMRSRELRSLGRDLRSQFLAAQEGKRSLALIEGDGTALTSNYIRLRATGEKGNLVSLPITAEAIVERR